MSKKAKVVSAGGVVLRERPGGPEVLLIHRNRYGGDWTLPKGHRETGELPPETALREIQEETGVQAVLDLRLPSARYQVDEGRKVVHFWRASVVRQRRRKPDEEVAAVKWVPAAEALKKVTYDTDRIAIERALEAPRTNVLLIVRHAKAMQRKHWTGNDQRRRLSGRGRRQAKRLADLLAAFGIERLVSSSSERCVQTLQPYAKAARLEIEKVDALTEESGSKNPKAVRQYLADLLKRLDAPTAICGHRPILPDMYAGLGLGSAPMVVAESRGLHVSAGEIVLVETFKPTA